MIPRNPNIPGRGTGAIPRAIGRPRALRKPTSYSTGAPPTSFAPLPLRSGASTAIDDAAVYEQPYTFPASPPRPLAPTGSIPVPLSPRRLLLTQELAGIDPYAVVTPSAVKYDVPLERRSKINPSFEPTPEETLEQLAAAFEPEPEPEPLPTCPAAAQKYAELQRIRAPEKLEIDMGTRRRPKVNPSFECSPDLMTAISEEDLEPEEAAAPCVAPKRPSFTPARIPPPVKFEVPADDRRAAKVIPSYDRTPEENLPPLEVPPPPKKKQTRGPKASTGGLAWEVAMTEQAPRAPRVRHSFEDEEEAQIPELAELQETNFPVLQRPSISQIRRMPPTQTRPSTGAQKKAPTRAPPRAPARSQSARAPATKGSYNFGGYIPPPPKPRKVPDKPPDKTSEDLVPRKKPPPAPAPLSRVGGLLGVGPGITKGNPPKVSKRTIATSYNVAPQQEGATPVTIREEVVVEQYPEMPPQTEQDMMTLARKRYSALRGKTPAPPAPPAAPAPPARPAPIKAAPPEPLPPALKKMQKRSKQEEDMMALARKRYTESMEPQSSRGSQRPRMGSLAAAPEYFEPAARSGRTTTGGRSQQASQGYRR